MMTVGKSTSFRSLAIVGGTAASEAVGLYLYPYTPEERLDEYEGRKSSGPTFNNFGAT
jgi:hypothetical protein